MRFGPPPCGANGTPAVGEPRDAFAELALEGVIWWAQEFGCPMDSFEMGRLSLPIGLESRRKSLILMKRLLSAWMPQIAARHASGILMCRESFITGCSCYQHHPPGGYL